MYMYTYMYIYMYMYIYRYRYRLQVTGTCTCTCCVLRVRVGCGEREGREGRGGGGGGWVGGVSMCLVAYVCVWCVLFVRADSLPQWSPQTAFIRHSGMFWRNRANVFALDLFLKTEKWVRSIGFLVVKPLKARDDPHVAQNFW